MTFKTVDEISASVVTKPDSPIAEQVRAHARAVVREAEAIATRALSFNRNLSDGEQRVLDEYSAAAAAMTKRAKELEEGEQRTARLEESFRAQTGGTAPGQNVRSTDPMFAVDQMLMNPDQRGQRISVEVRALTAANAGARTNVAAAGLRPAFLHALAGIPFVEADSLTVSGPKWAALSAQAATAEAGAKPVLTDPTLATTTLAAYARTVLVSDQMLRFGVGASTIVDRLTAEVINDVNTAVVNAVEAAATAQAFATSAAVSVDTAIAKVISETGACSAILVNPADYPLFSVKTGSDSGDDIGSRVVAWNGVPIVPHGAVDAGFATVLNGAGFSLHGTSMDFKSLDVLESNQIRMRAEMYAGLLTHVVGSAIKADIIV